MPVSVAVMMSMIVRGPMVQAIIGLERCQQCDGRQPVLGNQRLDLGTLLQADAVGEDLHRDMAVAERQDETGDGGEILGPHLDYRFDIGHDFDQPAIVEHEKVVSAQMGRLRKVKLDTGTPAAEHKALLPAAVVEFQQQGIDAFARLRIMNRGLLRRLAAAFAAGDDTLRAGHRSKPAVSAR
jgi:hypothetical protein